MKTPLTLATIVSKKAPNSKPESGAFFIRIREESGSTARTANQVPPNAAPLQRKWCYHSCRWSSSTEMVSFASRALLRKVSGKRLRSEVVRCKAPSFS